MWVNERAYRAFHFRHFVGLSPPHDLIRGELEAPHVDVDDVLPGRGDRGEKADEFPGFATSLGERGRALHQRG